jgi:hypothetical protein
LAIALSFQNRTVGLDDTLTKAFGIAMDDIDTNAYRRERNRLFNGLTKAKADLQMDKISRMPWFVISYAVTHASFRCI